MLKRTAKAVGRVVAIGVMLLSAGALAHEGEKHGAGKHSALKGTLQTVADSQLTVKGTDGKTVNVHVDDSTKYEKGGAAGTAADLKVGSRVVVHGEPMKDGILHATKVRFGKPGAKPAPTPDTGKEGAAAKKKDESGNHSGHDPKK